jgi:hypothetical protein
VTTGFICEYEALPLYKWFSNEDVTGRLPGLVCRVVENPPTGTSARSWATAWKIIRLIESFP